MAGFSGPDSAQSQLSPQTVSTGHHPDRAMRTLEQAVKKSVTAGPWQGHTQRGWHSGGDTDDLDDRCVISNGSHLGRRAQCRLASGMLGF